MSKTKDINEVNYDINVIILSMSSKQKVLDQIESETFKADLYNEYIKYLISVNLQLLGFKTKNKKKEYQNLIDKFLTGKIVNEKIIINKLVKTSA